MIGAVRVAHAITYVSRRPRRVRKPHYISYVGPVRNRKRFVPNSSIVFRVEITSKIRMTMRTTCNTLTSKRVFPKINNFKIKNINLLYFYYQTMKKPRTTVVRVFKYFQFFYIKCFYSYKSMYWNHFFRNAFKPTNVFSCVTLITYFNKKIVFLNIFRIFWRFWFFFFNVLRVIITY